MGAFANGCRSPCLFLENILIMVKEWLYGESTVSEQFNKENNSGTHDCNAAYTVLFCQVTFGDNKSDLKNAQNQQNDIQNKKKETEDKIAQLKAQSSDLTSLIQGLDAQMGELSASLDDINTRLQSLKLRLRRHRQSLSRLRLIRKASMRL